MTAQERRNAELGMIWWNRLSKAERAAWLAVARSDVPADAWAAFQSWADAPVERQWTR